MDDPILFKLLEGTGGLRNIYDAMNSDDLADVVRATYIALIEIKSLPMRQWHVKAANISNEHRANGNKFYDSGDYETAIVCYNCALAYGPNNSLEVKLAHANSSAVMFTIQAYQACLDHINACFALGCPEYLKPKLKMRMDKTKLINTEKIPDETLKKHLDFNVERNADVPCASKDIDFLDKNGSKEVIAAREIKSGTIVAMERAFVSTQTDNKQYISCYYCHKIALFLLPCDGCCKALFCSEECKTKCYNEYHRIECHIVGYMGTLYVQPVNKLMVRTGIMLSLKLGWNELSVASKDIGIDKLKKSSFKSAFDINDPHSILSYDDQKTIVQGKIFNGSFTCAAALYCLELVPNFFPKGDKAKKDAMDAIARIMLHLCATFTNRINIDCSAYDYYVKSNKTHIQRNVGWFSFTSKLKHSCEPNLYVLGLNDHVALVALRPIKKGEELTITYVDHYYETIMKQNYRSEKFSNIRQQWLISTIQYLCTCRVCVNRWDASSFPNAPLTEAHTKFFLELQTYAHWPNKLEYAKILTASATALDAFATVTNTMQHWSTYNIHRLALVECHCAKTRNQMYTKRENV